MRVTLVNSDELAVKISQMSDNEAFDFYEEYLDVSGDLNGSYGVKIITDFDTRACYINYYGGGNPLLIDVSSDDDCTMRGILKRSLSEYFENIGFYAVYIKSEDD